MCKEMRVLSGGEAWDLDEVEGGGVGAKHFELEHLYHVNTYMCIILSVDHLCGVPISCQYT